MHLYTKVTVTLSLLKLCRHPSLSLFLMSGDSQHRWAVLQSWINPLVFPWNSFPLQGRCLVPSSLTHHTANNNLWWQVPLTTIHHHCCSPQCSVAATMWMMGKDTAHRTQLSTQDHFCGYRLCSLQAWPGVSGCGRDEFSYLVWQWIPEKIKDVIHALRPVSIDIITHMQCTMCP